MPNTIEWGIILQQKLDEQLIQSATSGWMEANAGQVQYHGGKEVKVPILKTDGLGDYGRNGDGYPVGDIDLKYQTFEMRMDRGREFNFDRHDVDESNYIVNAANVLAQFQRSRVVPEIDSYRYSTIAAEAIAAGYTNVLVPTVDNILTKLNDDITIVQDRTGVDQVVIMMNRQIYGILANSKELSRNLDAASFAQGGVQLQIKSLDGHPILPVPSARMKTAYLFYDGKTTGQTTGGAVPASGAKDINWIICLQSAPLAISKQDQVKIFSPDINQDLDSWKTQYRRYHDIWVFENKLPAFHVSTRT